jgi:pimeloyl-ACP methyl ester carboxylesterase
VTSRTIAVVVAALLGYACEEAVPSYTPALTRARSAAFDPSVDEYFAAPWPDDRRLEADGTLATLDFPNPHEGELFGVLLRTAHRLSAGWGLSSPIYLPFTGAIDPATLPVSAASSLDRSATVRLFAIDPPSPAYLQRVPIEARWLDSTTPFLPGHVLAVRPLPGFPLAPGTRYALVVTDGVRDASGAPVGPDEALHRALVTPELADEAARTHFAPLREALAAAGLEPTQVAGATVFTTQRVFDELDALRATILNGPPPKAATIARSERPRSSNFTIFSGAYEAPRFQFGQPPYLTEGGEFRFDGAGRALASKMEQLRFVLCVPDGPVPAGGFPVAYYSHGTGGSYRTVVDDRTCADLTSVGLAVFGIDQVLHGPRADGATGCFTQPVEECFLNIVNAVGGRNSIRQSVADHLWLARLAADFMVPAVQDPFGREFGLDTRNPVFFGHSQGALTGALYAATEPTLAGAVLSAGGGHVTSTVLLRDGGALGELAAGDLFLKLAPDETFDAFHPALALMQTLAEPTDPLNYASRWHRTPEGRRKSIWLTSGLDDPFTPAATTVALAVAGRVPQLVGGDEAHVAFELAGLVPVAGPVRGNIPAAGLLGEVTAVLRQFPGEGHFPIFDVPGARVQLRAFLGSLAADGVATLPAGE